MGAIAEYVMPEDEARRLTERIRVTALVLDHGNLAEVRALAEAWRIRNHQLLEASMEDNQ